MLARARRAVCVLARTQAGRRTFDSEQMRRAPQGTLPPEKG